jgi:ligand-binding sensor domain-containing protein
VAALAESVDRTLWMADLSGDLWTLAAGDRWTRHPEMNGPALALAPAPDGSVWAATETGAQRLFEGRAEPVAGPALPGRPGAILAARDGRVWIATVSGTVHWTSGAPGDPWHAVTFAGWPRAAFRCLAQDRRGRIWAGSFGGGLVYGTADSPWTVWDSENGPFEAGVMSIMGDREGSVWFGLNAVGLAQWTGEAWSHRTEPGEGMSNRQLFSGLPAASRRTHCWSPPTSRA